MNKQKGRVFKKNLMRLLVSILNKSYLSLINRGLAYIRKLDTGHLKRALEHGLK
nr:hypothetical protein [Wolbachia endosymbiont of Litomosoides brasiliensis]